MKQIIVKLNYSTEQEYYKMLGVLMITQKLLNDYLAQAGSKGIGPEGFAEDWIRDFGVTGTMKDLVFQAFFNSLILVGKE